MEHRNFMKSKVRNLIFTFRKKNNKIKNHLIPTHLVIYTVLSKKHASILTKQQMKILEKTRQMAIKLKNNYR